VDFYSLGFLLKKTIFLLLFLAGMLFITKRFRAFLLCLFLLLYLLSIGPTKDVLMLPLENSYPVPSWNEMRSVDAIILLGGGANEHAPDIDGEGALTADSLQRLVAAFRLHAVLNKPIVVSGGIISGERPEADISKEVLHRLGVEEQFILSETRSKDTKENALFVSEICRKRNWNNIALVTSAYHMKRAMMLFGRFFNHIVPYPTDYKTQRRKYDYWSFLPDASNLEDTAVAVKEYLGIAFYGVQYRARSEQ
jgi:uncharacterized SAM-binding protein YcdF (DUF218 family)